MKFSSQKAHQKSSNIVLIILLKLKQINIAYSK